VESIVNRGIYINWQGKSMEEIKNLLAVIPFLRSYPLWAQIIVLICFLVIFVILIFVPHKARSTEEKVVASVKNQVVENGIAQSIQGSHNVQTVTIGNNSPVTNIGIQNNYPGIINNYPLLPTLEGIHLHGELSMWYPDGGNRQSYQILLSWEKDEKTDPALKKLISSEIKRVQEDYYTAPLRRFVDNEDGRGVSWVCKITGSEAKECSNGIEPSKGFDAANVLNHLYKTSPETPWQEYARAACILRNIQTAYNKNNLDKKKLFERLVSLMGEDERSLCVSKMAFETYKDLTGFSSDKVFDFEGATKDWVDRQEEILKRSL
jgi:hypothetical protein